MDAGPTRRAAHPRKPGEGTKLLWRTLWPNLTVLSQISSLLGTMEARDEVWRHAKRRQAVLCPSPAFADAPLLLVGPASIGNTLARQVVTCPKPSMRASAML